MKTKFVFTIAMLPEGRFIKDLDVLRWLRWHAKSQPEIASVFNQLADEVIGIGSNEDVPLR